MLAAARRFPPLGLRRPLARLPRYTLGATLPPVDRQIRAIHENPQWKRPFPNKRRTFYAVGGASIALVGLLWSRRTGNYYPDDPRDVRALSDVPLGKLCSGWV